MAKQGVECFRFAISHTRNHLSKKLKLFDTEVINITQNTTDIEIPIATTTNKLFKVYDTNHPEECWWIEYRAKNNKILDFDKNIEEEGLAIIHDSVGRLNDNSINSQRVPPHRRGESGYRLALEDASGRFYNQYYKTNLKGALYVENDEFSPYSFPSSVYRNRSPSTLKFTIYERLQIKLCWWM